MTRRSEIAVILYFLLAALPAYAGQPISLTVEDAVRVGLENSRMLHASSMKVEAADARTSELKTGRLFSLTATASYTHVSEVPPYSIPGRTLFPYIPDNYLARLSLVQPLFTGFRLWGGIRAADYSAEAARFDYEGDRRNFTLNVRYAYWNVFQAVESERVIKENVDQIEAHLNDARNLRSQGMATRNDVLRVEVQLSQTRLLQVQAVNAERVARVALNNLIGLPLTTDVGLSSRLSSPGEKGESLDSLVQTAAEKRPDMKAAGARVKAAEAGLTVARAGWYPQISLIADYTYARPNSRLLPPEDKFYGTWDVGAVLTYDIWSWGRTSYQTVQARAQLDQANDAYTQLKDAVALEITQDYLALDNAREKISVSKVGVAQARESHRIAQENYHAGVGSNTDLLDAEVALLQARLTYTQSLVEYELARARLRKAVGE